MEAKWTRTADGLTTTTEFGSALVSRTPVVTGVNAGRWTLHINGQFQDTFNTDADAINHAEAILSRPLVSKLNLEDVSTGDL